MINTPYSAISEKNPFDTLVGSIIHSLFYMSVFEFQSDSLHLDERLNSSIDFYSEITIGVFDRMFRCNFGIFIVSKYISEHVLDNCHGICFPGIARFGC